MIYWVMLNYDVEENDAYTIYCKLSKMGMAFDTVNAK